ncbi:glycosyltransferase [Microvirga aerilata]
MQRLLRSTVSRLKKIDLLRRIVSRARTIGFSRQSVALQHARRNIDAGNFNAAAAQIESMETKNARAWRILLDCYLTAHRFKDVIQAYEAMPEENRKDFACRHVYLLAAANLKQFDAVAGIIQGALNEPNSMAASEFLNKVRPFAERMGPDAHRFVVERIVSQRTWLAAEQFDTILKCAHDLREKGWEQDAIDLEKALRDAAGSARTGMKLDIFDAQLHFWSGRYDLQLASINSVLSKQGLTPVQLKDESAPFACENLKSAPANPPLQGPLVSILVPAYNSAGTISYVLESLRNQTYRDFEVIVVDDASTDDTASIVAPFCDADPRFRLLSMGRNSGVFVARNMALASATGEFVTNQDADDWAHPQKIATAVAELRRDQSIIATWVDHVRCSKQRGFRALNGYFRPDASSLMFRQKPVLETIGYYDSVRAAGDGEFHLRMGRSFGSRSIRKIDKLLSFVSWSDASLSGGGAFQIDSDLGLFSPARSAYRKAFGLWHETANPLYVPFPLEKRPFPIPDSLAPSPGHGS